MFDYLFKQFDFLFLRDIKVATELSAFGKVKIFCFFDMDNIVVVGHGFQKKSQKTPKQEIERAKQIKKEYYDSKE